MATPEERSAAASEQMSVAMANLVTTLTAQQAAADKKARDEEKREAGLKETTDMMAEALKENIKFDEDKAKEEKNQKVQTLEQEVASMKSDISEIKNLLREFLNGS